MKFSQEIRTETRISNINLKKTEKTDLRGIVSKRSDRRDVLILIWRKPKKKRLALKFSHEIRTETHISNFNLKGDLVCNIYVWGGIFGGGGGICFALYIWGGMRSALYTENLNLVRIFGGGGICSVLYTWRGMCSVFFSW